MTMVFAMVLIAVMGVAAVLATGRGGGLGPAPDDRPDLLLPADRALTGADLREVRLTTAMRGYRADEVDALLDRLAVQLDATADAAADATDATADAAADAAADGERGGGRPR